MSPDEPALLRIDNVSIFVSDLQAAIAFFVELGMELEGETTVEGQWVDRILGLEDVRCDIAMLRAPDGGCRIELSQFRQPAALGTGTLAPLNTLGTHRIMFAVTNIDEVVARLLKRGAELIGEIVQYKDIYRLCYLRGPEGIILALAERLKAAAG